MEILVGRNNRQNDLLSMKMAERSDLWLHTKNSPGTHVIIKLPRQIKSIHDMPDRSLEEAALLAAHFSKAAESEKVEVDYTFRSNVKKPGGARPGMVIYDQYWTLVVNPQEDRLQEILSREVKMSRSKAFPVKFTLDFIPSIFLALPEMNRIHAAVPTQAQGSTAFGTEQAILQFLATG